MSARPPEPLAISMGEPAGIGPDLILKLYAERDRLGVPPFVVYGHAEFLRERARRLELDLFVADGTPETAQELFADALPVVSLEGPCPDRPGMPVSETAPIVTGAIAAAVGDIRTGKARALVTAPIHKSALYEAGFTHPGHTEYLAALCTENGQTPYPVMMLAHEGYRVVPLTVHVPLRNVPELVTTKLIVETVRIVARDLATRFGIAAPKLAVTGLNPHAGEDGTIGTEEQDIIAPALDTLRGEGLEVTGPLSADTLFHPPHWRSFDCVIAMYHDQALIPIKTLAFDEGVNVTLGLPIIRTSPDHGTALALAGTGTASPNSLMAAIRLADRLSTDT